MARQIFLSLAIHHPLYTHTKYDLRSTRLQPEDDVLRSLYAAPSFLDRNYLIISNILHNNCLVHL